MVCSKLSKVLLWFACAVLVMLASSVSALAVERYEVMQYGDKDEYVLRLQKELYVRGYMETEPTGYFGKETQKAVARYQERHDLTSDGKAGPATQKEIFGKYYEPIPSTREVKETDSSSSSSSSSDAESLRNGDEGSTVKKVQRRLRELGYYTYGKTTYYYGDITESAVVSFQSQNGLTADGVVGKKTYAKLFSDKAKSFDKSKEKSSSSTSSSKTKSTGATSQSSKGKASASSIVETAKSLIGKKYRSGASGPNTFDCSGFVYYVLKSYGISTPRTSSAMSKYSSWTKIESQSDLKKGDLVFFTSPSKSSGVGHVGIYLGGGEFIHSSSGSAYGVTISSLSSGSYSKRYQWGRRIFD